MKIENAERQREICCSLSVQKGSVRNAERQRERMCLCFECVEVFTFGSSQYVSIGYKPCVGGGAVISLGALFALTMIACRVDSRAG